MSLIGTVLVEHSRLLLLKNLTIEGQKNSVATDYMLLISIGVAMVAGFGSSTGLKSELWRHCSAFEQHVCSAFVQETND